MTAIYNLPKNWKEQQSEPRLHTHTFLADGYQFDPAPWWWKAAGAYVRGWGAK